MTDYVSCPTCHGRGLIPAEDAAVIEAHASTEYSETQKLQRLREQEMHEKLLAAKLADAAARQASLDRATRHANSAAEYSPEEIAALKERLQRLEAEDEEAGS